MGSHHAPALWPAALFVAGLALQARLTPLTLGLPFLGVALGWALGSRKGRLFAALCAGLVVGVLAPESTFRGLDRERVVEIAGRVGSGWIREPGGVRGRLLPTVVKQDTRLWLSAPMIALDLPESVTPPSPGSSIRVRGFLRRSAGFANERESPAGRWRLRVKSAHFLAIEQPPSSAAVRLTRFRDRVASPFAAHAAGHPGVGYARALLFGELDAIPEGEQRAFRRSGLAHLLAVSGMNVALVVAFVATAGAFLGRGLRLALSLVAVTAHLLLVGPEPSLRRASAMAAIAFLALVLARPPLALQGLALTVATLTAAAPALLRDLGFQLSCAATLGIVLLAPWIARRWHRGPRALRLALATSVAAQIATMPLSVAAFSSASPGGIVLNLVFVPLASLLLVSAFAWAGLALLAPALGGILAWPLDLAAAPFAALVRLPAGPWLSIPTAGTLGAGLLASGALLLLATRRPQRRLVALGGFLLILAGAQAPERREFELVMADVGQGEGVLLRAGSHALLVDGGGVRGRDLAAQVWLPLLARRGIAALDAMVVTHADADHCGGLVDVAVHVPVRELWGPSAVLETACVRELSRWSRARWRGLEAGDRVALGAASLEVLAPEPGLGTALKRSSNQASLVFRVDAGGRRMLLTGDLDGTAEENLAARAGEELACDVLKIGHHGSARATGQALLRAARPRLALVSAGFENRFGHPSDQVVGRLNRSGARLLRTDLQGEIVLRWKAGGPIQIQLPGIPRPDG